MQKIFWYVRFEFCGDESPVCGAVFFDQKSECNLFLLSPAVSARRPLSYSSASSGAIRNHAAFGFWKISVSAEMLRKSSGNDGVVVSLSGQLRILLNFTRNHLIHIYLRLSFIRNFLLFRI